MKLVRIVIIAAAILAALATIVAAGIHDRSTAAGSRAPAAPTPVTLPATPETYLGVYVPGVPDSYAPVTAFTAATGVRPRVSVYYSGWLEPFRTSFAATAAQHGVLPLVQIEPTGISLNAIAAGKYDGYLSSYAEAVRDYGRAVILSFGHEMNGSWYSWSNRRSSPASYVAAWRHIVQRVPDSRDRERDLAVDGQHHRRARPASPTLRPWWPGSSYVTWVGIDGYYSTPSATFAPLFGPTIVAVRALTSAPILIAETGAANTASQPAQIADAFAGVRTYGLLGLIWFDAKGKQDWRLVRPSPIAAFRQGAEAYHGPAS